MDYNYKWGTVLLNATLGGGYVTLILLDDFEMGSPNR